MKQLLRAAKQLPSDPVIPLLGNVQALFSSPELNLWNCYQRHGKFFKIEIPGMKIAVLVGPEANQFVLNDQAGKFSTKRGYWFLKRNLGDGILLQDGSEHRATRKLIQPAFHTQAINSYFKTILDTVEQFFDSWEENTPIRCSREFHKLTFRIACKLLLSNQNEQETEQLYSLFSKYVRGTASVSTLLGLNIPQTTYGRARIAHSQLQKILQAKIAHRRAIGDTSPRDMLSLLLSATDEQGQALSDSEVITNMLQLLFAARDTTARQLCWLILELALHPQWAERLRHECSEVTVNAPLEMLHLKHFTCMGWVLKEVERLYPPVYIIPRGVIDDVEFAGYHIPAGWHVNVSPLLTHRLEEIYSRPESFEPERFAPPREEHKKHNFALIGFGGGVHKCLGYELAQMEMKIILSIMLRRFRWNVTPTEFEISPSFQPFEVLQELQASVQLIRSSNSKTSQA